MSGHATKTMADDEIFKSSVHLPENLETLKPEWRSHPHHRDRGRAAVPNSMVEPGGVRAHGGKRLGLDD